MQENYRLAHLELLAYDDGNKVKLQSVGGFLHPPLIEKEHKLSASRPVTTLA